MSPFSPTELFSPTLSDVLEYADCEGADRRECLQAAEEIYDGDSESWHISWFRLAEQVRHPATRDLSSGRQTEARNTFLRAARYYQAAGRFLGRNPHDARIATTAEASGACFATATRLSAPLWQSKEIDVGGARRIANLHRVDADPRPRSTLLAVGEAGATLQELYFSCAVAANRRGWHCLAIAADKSDPAFVARSLLTASSGFADIDPGCLALLMFGDEPASPLAQGRRRGVTRRAMGSARDVAEALERNGSDDPETFRTLGSVHQRIARWLDSAE